MIDVIDNLINEFLTLNNGDKQIILECSFNFDTFND